MILLLLVAMEGAIERIERGDHQGAKELLERGILAGLQMAAKSPELLARLEAALQ